MIIASVASVLPTLVVALSSIAVTEYMIALVGIAIVFGLFAAAVDFSLGQIGVLTLGAGLYFGIGAYAVAIGMWHNINYLVCVATGAAIACAVALLLGIVTLRVGTDNIQFALITLVVSLAVGQIVVNLYNFAGGSNGIAGVGAPVISIGALSWNTAVGLRYFACVFVTCAIMLLLLQRLRTSHFGRVASCIRESEERAATWGYNVLAFRLFAGAVTAIVSAIAGSLFVPFVGICDPGLFAATPNMLVLVWVSFGGEGTLFGPFCAAVFLKIAQFMLGSRFEDYYLLMIGLLLVIAVRAARGRGIVAALRTKVRP